MGEQRRRCAPKEIVVHVWVVGFVLYLYLYHVFQMMFVGKSSKFSNDHGVHFVCLSGLGQAVFKPCLAGLRN